MTPATPPPATSSTAREIATIRPRWEGGGADGGIAVGETGHHGDSGGGSVDGPGATAGGASGTATCRSLPQMAASGTPRLSAAASGSRGGVSAGAEPGLVCSSIRTVQYGR